MSRTEKQEIYVSDQDREIFLKCLITGERFEKEYSMFNGIYRIVFRELSPLDLKFVGASIQNQEISQMDGLFIASIKSISVKTPENDKTKSYDPISESQDIKELGRRFLEISREFLHTADRFLKAQTLFGDFRELLMTLYKQAEDPDFFSKMNII